MTSDQLTVGCAVSWIRLRVPYRWVFHSRSWYSCYGPGLLRITTTITNEAEPKIDDLQTEMLVQQDILWFDIPMGDVHLMQVPYCIQDLLEDKLGLLLWEVALGFAFYVLVQGIAAPVFHYQVYLRLIRYRVLSCRSILFSKVLLCLGALSSSGFRSIFKCSWSIHHSVTTSSIFLQQSCACCSSPQHYAPEHVLLGPNHDRIGCLGTIFNTILLPIFQAFHCTHFILTACFWVSASLLRICSMRFCSGSLVSSWQQPI